MQVCPFHINRVVQVIGPLRDVLKGVMQLHWREDCHMFVLQQGIVRALGAAVPMKAGMALILVKPQQSDICNLFECVSEVATPIPAPPPFR